MNLLILERFGCGLTNCAARLERIPTLDVAAASGLDLVGDEIFVIANDELELAR